MSNLLDQILKLLDELSKLASNRKRNDLEYIERYAQPAYELSQEVFRDYMKLLASLRQRVANGESRESLLLFLEKARAEYLAARIRLRALLFQYSQNDMPLFEQGIFRLLHGGLVHLEETAVLRSYRIYGEHTLLDITYEIKYREGISENTLPIEKINRLIEAQERTIEHAFKEISLGFEALRKNVVPKRRRKK